MKYYVFSTYKGIKLSLLLFLLGCIHPEPRVYRFHMRTYTHKDSFPEIPIVNLKPN